MKAIVWILTVLVVVYWCPRLFIRHMLPMFCTCKVEEILPNVYKLSVPLHHAKNVYILSGGPLTVIDPGLFTPLACLKKGLKAMGMDITDVELILASHYHIDHSACIGALSKASGAKVVAHEKDKPFISGVERHRYPNAPWLLRAGLFLVSILFHDYTANVDIVVKDGDQIDALGGLTVIHTPGHTDGSICFHSSRLKLLFSGDALQAYGGTMTRAKVIYSENLASDLESIRKLSNLDFNHLLPGDGHPVIDSARSRLTTYLSTLD